MANHKAYIERSQGKRRCSQPGDSIPLKGADIQVVACPRKGGPPAVFDTLRKSPGLEDIWQGHLALLTPKEVNTEEKMIANFEPTAECKGNSLRL